MNFASQHWNIPGLAVHPMVLAVYFALRMEESVEEHSGYDVYYSPWRLIRNNDHHDFHHSHNVGSYGTFPFWDWFCGTDKAYREWKQKQTALAGAQKKDK